MNKSIKIIGPEKCLFGTDTPYAHTDAALRIKQWVEDLSISDIQKEQTNRGEKLRNELNKKDLTIQDLANNINKGKSVDTSILTPEEKSQLSDILQSGRNQTTEKPLGGDLGGTEKLPDYHEVAKKEEVDLVKEEAPPWET